MNHLYLMQHVSYHLHTIVRRLTLTLQETEKYCGRYSFEDTAVFPAVLSYFKDEAKRKALPPTPRLVSLNGLLAYFLVPCPKFCFLVGPVRFTEPVYYRFQTTGEIPETQWLDTVPFCQPGGAFLRNSAALQSVSGYDFE